MRISSRDARWRLFTFVSALGVMGACSALAQTAPTASPAVGGRGAAPPTGGPEASAANANTVGEIVVTAQKRSERLNSVPLTVSAASGDTLSRLGVADSRDLAKIVPGFTFTETPLATPVYTLRGVGFYDSSLGATPAVTVYADQVPLTYPQMTRNAAFDLERVEVLKGPQGTLFGQNSTGGAVNYIAAKPTSTLKAGVEVTGGSYGTADVSAFVGGPIAPTLTARLAFEHDSQGDWQKSYTRPDDTRGQVDLTKARLLVDWRPNAKLQVELSASGWKDGSDTQAAQLVGRTPTLAQTPEFYAYPLAPANDRAADWSPNFPKSRDDGFYLLSTRIDYQLTDRVKLTSLTSYARLTTSDPVDSDGTALNLANSTEQGAVRTFDQEVRAEAQFSTTRLVVGANFARDRINETQLLGVEDASTSMNTSLPGLPVQTIRSVALGSARTYAFFGNVEQKIGDRLSLQGGVRYTDDKRGYDNCLQDVGGRFGPSIAALANFVLRPALGIPGTTVITPNSCVTLNNALQPTTVTATIDQDNVSWRVGPSFKLSPNTLLYANVSKGYKAGTAPTIFGVFATSYTPTTQESVLAYEAGIKSSTFRRRLQINAATFYYDYSDKQILGTALDPVFGSLAKLVNIPKSELYGGEIELTAAPIQGLSVTASANYTHSEVTKDFLNYNSYGSPVNFKGESFPYTPEWQAALNAQYTFPISDKINLFVGGNLTYSSATDGFFGSNIPYNPADPQHRSPQGVFPSGPLVQDATHIRSYSLLDLRLGAETADGRIRLMLWGRNVTDRYYWSNATYYPADTTVRFAGRPATFGATLSYRY